MSAVLEYAPTPRPGGQIKERKSNSAGSSPSTSTRNPKCQCSCAAEVKRLKSELKRAGEQRTTWQTKCTLLEERVRRDTKRIQSLELLSKQDPKLTHADENKYLKEIDTLSSKIYKLEEKNQSLVEEIAALKVEVRNRKKDYESSVKDIQSKHDLNTRSLTQTHKNYADGVKKGMKKELEDLRHRLAVQETDLHKQYQRHMQDIKIEAAEREVRLKEVIRKLQDSLHSIKVADRRDALRGGDKLAELLGEDDALLNDDINDSPLFTKNFKQSDSDETATAAAEEEEEEEEEDPDECY